MLVGNSRAAISGNIYMVFTRTLAPSNIHQPVTPFNPNLITYTYRVLRVCGVAASGRRRHKHGYIP